MLETLHCEVGDHEFTRERKKGVKPRVCPEHKAESAPKPRSAKEGVVLNFRTDSIQAVLNGSESELQRKLAYVVTQLETNQHNREDQDVAQLKETYTKLQREADKNYKNYKNYKSYVSVMEVA